MEGLSKVMAANEKLTRKLLIAKNANFGLGDCFILLEKLKAKTKQYDRKKSFETCPKMYSLDKKKLEKTPISSIFFPM